MGPLKTLGIDDFPTHFYEHYWDIIGNGIVRLFLGFLIMAVILAILILQELFLFIRLITSRICLIFARLVFVMFCIIIVEVFDNHLKKKILLDIIILMNQSAFILVRHITDNKLVAYELLHALNRERDRNKTHAYEQGVQPHGVKFFRGFLYMN